jgi:hypothetical protein
MSKEKQIEEIFNDVIEAEHRFHEHCLANTCHNCEYNGDGECDNHIKAEYLYNAGYRKQSENATLEAVDNFRSALVDKFIDLCRGNDFNKINLLLIGETIDRTFDDVVAKMKGGE